MLSAQILLTSCDRIDRLACDLLKAAECGDIDAFLSRRNHVASDLKHHLIEELRAIGSKLLVTGDATTRGQVKCSFDEIEAFDTAWNGHLTEWSDEAITADTQIFLSEGWSMVTTMRVRIKYWTGLLCALALRDGIIRLRTAEATPARMGSPIRAPSARNAG